MSATGFIAVIPARYGSSRLPGKPLKDIAGKPMIEWVYRQAMGSGASEVIVATDDERIAEACRAFGAPVELTAAEHPSGTDRIAELARRFEWDDEQIVVNVQGDEPLMPAENVDRAVETLAAGDARRLATLATTVGADSVRDPNMVKVVVAADGRALYFSRSPIPYWRRGVPAYRKHLGIYAYRAETLAEVAALPQSPLERAESLEQLRWLEAGHAIWVGEAAGDSIGVDTPADLAEAERRLAKEALT